ncbi:GIY-YIG nuclease family protein [Paenibacillus mendelii]|uniref:GIY-YIG nuclease family protein n=1 Tax=Paenibacillus mendelii TaxID=206163 RepID=A0ABV6JD43_9BACL|nr:GIY-YIG nuclease family protein [Paenibacillus mendelii]MCQ6562711.1 GIY-YIG nuclease family protein [Paenibacillus mendelii]
MPAYSFKPSEFPNKPGCYLMKNEAGRILYVGKSKALRTRLRSYFNGRVTHKRIARLVEEVAAIEVIVVNNEHESLLLENNLIKMHKPPYNRALKKDNSGYAYLKMTDEPFPRLDVYYRDRKGIGQAAASGFLIPHEAKEGDVAAEDSVKFAAAAELTQSAAQTAAASDRPRTASGSAAANSREKRFGPFASARFRDALLAFITDHYKLRTCTTMPKKVCLLYHLKRCSGICEGLISEEEYRETARQAAALLDHRGDKLIAAMYAQMENYSQMMEFEKAGSMLRHIRILERTPDKQIVDRESNVNQDVVYFGESNVLVGSFHQGMLRHVELLDFERTEGGAACDRFLIDRYGHSRPDEIIVNEIGDLKRVMTALRQLRKPPLKISLPRRGLKYELLKLCKANYELRLERERHAKEAGQSS